MKATKYSQYLQAREHLQYVDTPHWIYIVEGVIVTAAILIAGFFIEGYIVNQLITPRLAANPLLDDWFINLAGWAALIVKWGTLLIAVAFFVNRIVYFMTTYVFASERRLYVKTGLLLARVEEINFEEIKSALINYGFFGRVLGYGKINMDARFVKDSDIPFVYNPENFMKLINYESDLTKDVNLSFATSGMSDGNQIKTVNETQDGISKREQQMQLVQKYEKKAKENKAETITEVIEHDFEDAVMDDGEQKSKKNSKRLFNPTNSIDFD